MAVELYDEDFGRSDEMMGYAELFCDTFQFESTHWLPLLQGQGEVQVSLKYLGSSFEKFVTSASPFWQKWPIVKTLFSKIPGLSQLSIIRHLILRLPTYFSVARARYSGLAFFTDTHSVLPKANYKVIKKE